MGGFNRADGHGTQGGKDVLVEGEAVEPGSGWLAVDLHVGANESLGEVGHGGVGLGRRGHRVLAALDAIDDGGGLLTGLIGRDRSVLPDGDALGPIGPPALDDIGLPSGGVDPDTETRKVTVPVESIVAVGGKGVDGALGDGTVVWSRHGVPRCVARAFQLPAASKRTASG